MRKKYERLIKELPLEACSRDLVSIVIENSGIREQNKPELRVWEYGRGGWVYRLATLLIIMFLTGTAIADLKKPDAVDYSRWAVNSVNLVKGVAQNTTAAILLNEGKGFK